MTSPSPASPVSMELPEEIEKAVITLCQAEGALGNLSLTGRNYQRAMTAAYEAREALTAAILSRLREAEAGRWQPIETAPKDCAVVLVALNGCTTAARHFEDHGWYEINSHWTDAWGGEIWPNHWMPLPDAPALSEAPSQGDQ